MREIIPAVLEESAEDTNERIRLVEDLVNWVHLDVMPGTDVLTLDPRTDVEVHLMVPNPEEVITAWVDAGADRVAVHKLSEAILLERSHIEVGLAVELHVPLDAIYEDLGRVDFVQLMSIAEIGSQGHKFEPEIFDRIRELSREFPEITISVDGGVSLENAEELFDAGADRLIVGSAIWKSADPLEALEDLIDISKQ